MWFVRAVYFYISLFLSHLLFIFTSPYVPFPDWLPWLSIPVPNIRAIPSRIRSYIPPVYSFPSRLSPFPGSPPNPPPSPANQDSQDSSRGHSSPTTKQHSRKGKGRNKNRFKTHQNFNPGTGLSWSRAGDGRDLEQGSLEEEEERKQRRGYRGIGRGRGESQTAGRGSLNDEEQRGGREGRGRGSQISEERSLDIEEERGGRGGGGRGSQIAGRGSLNDEEQRGGREGRGRGSQIAEGRSLKSEEERGGREGRGGGGGGGSHIAEGRSLKIEEEIEGRGGGGGGSQIARRGSLKNEEERGGREGRARGSQIAGRGSLRNDEQRGGRGSQTAGRGGLKDEEERVLQTAGRGSLKDNEQREGRGKRTSDYEITNEMGATKAKRGKQGKGAEERRRSGRRGREERTRDFGPSPRGLPNLGQTCYMNCVLQSLYHLEPLAEVFRKLQDPRNRGDVVLATMNLWAALREGGDLEDRVRALKFVAGTRDEDFRGYAQKEAHDFLAQLLDWLHTDLADENGAAQEHNGDVGAEQGSEKVESPISRLFRTTQLNSIRCGRTGKSLTEMEEAALNLSLPVTRDGPTRLEDVIKKSFTPQMMMWDCDECEGTHECESRTDITKLPEILVLHLSRVSEAASSHRKVRVSYPEAGLEMGATKGGESRSYKLAAVCCHEGGMHGGHYTAFCRVNALWFSFNDTFVRRAQPNQVLDRPTAHILFYEAEDMSFRGRSVDCCS